MFYRVLRESFARARRRKALAIAAVALGTAVATAMLTVSLDVEDRMGRELRSFGANIVATPAADSLAVEVGGIDYRPVAEGAFIRESDLPKLKNIFWRNAIGAFSPYLYVPGRIKPVGDGRTISTVIVGAWMDHEFQASDGQRFRTGARATNPAWQVDGSWPVDGSHQALAGRALAARFGEGGIRPGSRLEMEAGGGSDLFVVSGVLTTGGAEDDQVFLPLEAAQKLAGRPGQVRKVQISAVIKPDDDFGRRDPATMTREEYDRWYCTPYIGAIVKQVQEALPGVIARPIRQVAENEGAVLSKIQWLMLLITAAALAAAALAIGSATSSVVIERRAEIALMKALGSSDRLIAAFFLGEAAVQGLLGGVLGYGLGVLLANSASRAVFGAPAAVALILFPLAVFLALAVSLAGALPPLRSVVRLLPAPVLKEQR